MSLKDLASKARAVSAVQPVSAMSSSTWEHSATALVSGASTLAARRWRRWLALALEELRVPRCTCLFLPLRIWGCRLSIVDAITVTTCLYGFLLQRRKQQAMSSTHSSKELRKPAGEPGSLLRVTFRS